MDIKGVELVRVGPRPRPVPPAAPPAESLDPGLELDRRIQARMQQTGANYVTAFRSVTRDPANALLLRRYAEGRS